MRTHPGVQVVRRANRMARHQHRLSLLESHAVHAAGEVALLILSGAGQHPEAGGALAEAQVD
jgi:hypothetical protein